MIAYASSGDFVRWNPHLHALFLEGGFDTGGRFVHVPSHEQEPHLSVSQKETRSAWPRGSRSYHPSPRSAKRTAGARLIAKVYEVDHLRCARCGSKMGLMAVITDPQQVRRILRHLVKTGEPLLSAVSTAQQCERPRIRTSPP